VDVCIHEPHGKGDQRNHHAHILCSTRRLGPDGFGEKSRELDDRKTGPQEVTHCRELWASLANRALQRTGTQARVDHRSLIAQRAEALEQGEEHRADELQRAPTVHLGPAATALERKKVQTCHTDRGEQCRGRERLNRGAEQLRQESAQLDASLDQLSRELDELVRTQQAALEVETTEAASQVLAQVEPQQPGPAPQLEQRQEEGAEEQKPTAAPEPVQEQAGPQASPEGSERQEESIQEAEPPISVPAPEVQVPPERKPESREQLYLRVPFEENEQAKAAGARFDWSEKRWYAPEGAPLASLARWSPQQIPASQAPNQEPQRQASGLLYGPPALTSRPILFEHLSPSVQQNGDVLYQLADGGAVTDRRRQVAVEQLSTQAVRLALELAQERFGDQPLIVEGTTEFQHQVAAAAAEYGLQVRFSDPALEAARAAAERKPSESQPPTEQQEPEHEAPFPEVEALVTPAAPPEPTQQEREAQEDAKFLAGLQKMTIRQLEQAEKRERPLSVQDMLEADEAVLKARTALLSAESKVLTAEETLGKRRTAFSNAQDAVEDWHKEHWIRSTFGSQTPDDLAEAVKARASELQDAAQAHAAKLEAHQKAQAHLEGTEARVLPIVEAKHARKSERHAAVLAVLAERRQEKERLRPVSVEGLMNQAPSVIADRAKLAELQNDYRDLAEKLSKQKQTSSALRQKGEAWRDEHPMRADRYHKGKGQFVAKPLWELDAQFRKSHAEVARLEKAMKEKNEEEWALRRVMPENREQGRKEAEQVHQQQREKFDQWRETHDPDELRKEREQERQRKRELERDKSKNRGQGRGR
jgi:hypothetical protein